MDYYDVSLVDGFNLPVSVATQGGSGDCQTSTCPANMNTVCPAKLQVKGSDGSVIACKSACTAFNEPQYCCTGAFNTPQTCPPTNYSKIFEDQCPQAYSYAYDDQNSTYVAQAHMGSSLQNLEKLGLEGKRKISFMQLCGHGNYVVQGVSMCSTILPNWVGFSWSWRHASYHPYSYYVHTSDSPVTFTDDSPMEQDYFIVY
ncbi:thaumatin-like protein 1 [Fagus crenata]